RGAHLHLLGAALYHNPERTWFGNQAVVLEVEWEDGEVATSLVERLPYRWVGSRENNWVPTVTQSPAFDYIVDPSRVYQAGSFTRFPIEDKYVELHGGTQAIPVNIGGRPHWLTISHRQRMLEDDYQS